MKGSWRRPFVKSSLYCTVCLYVWEELKWKKQRHCLWHLWGIKHSLPALHFLFFFFNFHFFPSLSLVSQYFIPKIRYSSGLLVGWGNEWKLSPCRSASLSFFPRLWMEVMLFVFLRVLRDHLPHFRPNTPLPHSPILLRDHHHRTSHHSIRSTGCFSKQWSNFYIY